MSRWLRESTNFLYNTGLYGKEVRKYGVHINTTLFPFDIVTVGMDKQAS